MKKVLNTFEEVAKEVIAAVNTEKYPGVKIYEIEKSFKAGFDYSRVPKIRFNRNKAEQIVFETLANSPYRGTALEGSGYDRFFVSHNIHMHFGWSAATCKYNNSGAMSVDCGKAERRLDPIAYQKKIDEINALYN
jgi:hypothetical protein